MLKKILTIFCSIEYVRKNNIRAYNFFPHICLLFYSRSCDANKQYTRFI